MDVKLLIHQWELTKAKSAKSLGIDKLNFEERTELIGEIQDGLFAETEDLALLPELKEELDRRLKAADTNHALTR